MDTRDLLLGIAVGAIVGLALGSLKASPKTPHEPTAFQATLTVAMAQAKGKEVALWLEGSGQPIMGKLVEAVPGGCIKLDMGQGSVAVVDEGRATAFLIK